MQVFHLTASAHERIFAVSPINQPFLLAIAIPYTILQHVSGLLTVYHGETIYD